MEQTRQIEQEKKSVLYALAAIAASIQTGGITASIPVFMVVMGDIHGSAQKTEIKFNPEIFKICRKIARLLR